MSDPREGRRKRPGYTPPVSQETLVYAGHYGPSLFSGFEDRALRKLPTFHPVFSPGSLFFGKEQPMFSPHFLDRKSLWLKSVFSLFFVVCLVMGSTLFSGCDWNGGEDHFSLTGTWNSGYDGYVITPAAMIYTDDYGYGFTANIREIVEYSHNSGVILVEYTTLPTAYTPPGRFQGVYYKDLTAKSVKLGSAYNAASPGTPVEVTTLALAKEKFKLENIALYGGELTIAVPQTRK
jgi:hypothetical protein